MGYGRRAVQLLQAYYEGKHHSLSDQNSYSSVMPPSSAVSQVLHAAIFTYYVIWLLASLFSLH